MYNTQGKWWTYIKNFEVRYCGVFYYSHDELSNASFIKIRQPGLMIKISLYLLGSQTQVDCSAEYWEKKVP